MTTKLKFTAIAGALAIAAAGCGGDEKTSSSTSGDQGSSEAAPSKLALELTGKGKDLRFTGPESVAAGLVEISLKADVPGEHSAQLVRVDGAQTGEDVEAAGVAWGEKGKALAPWLHFDGGVIGQAGKTVTSTQVLEPGRYLAVDVRSEIKPSPSFEFEVTEGEEAELSEPEAGVEMKEYGFTATGLKAGAQQVLVNNVGTQPHFIVGAQLAKGATVEEAKKFFESEGDSEGPPPADFENSFETSILEGGGKQVIDLDLKAGKYVFVCFIPDRAGGPPHVAKGMVSEITVG